MELLQEEIRRFPEFTKAIEDVGLSGWVDDDKLKNAVSFMFGLWKKAYRIKEFKTTRPLKAGKIKPVLEREFLKFKDAPFTARDIFNSIHKSGFQITYDVVRAYIWHMKQSGVIDNASAINSKPQLYRVKSNVR